MSYLEHSSSTEVDEFVSRWAKELSAEEDISELLQERLGRLHAKLRLGIEADHERARPQRVDAVEPFRVRGARDLTAVSDQVSTPF